LYEKALENHDHPIWKKTFEKIREFNPDIIGLTSISAKIDSADKIAKFSKDMYGDKVKVILGGPHVEGMLKIDPDYNFGPYYDQIVPFIPDLVDRKPNKKLLFDYKEYTPMSLSDFLTSTACPNKCTFCCNSSGRSMVYRNLQSIEQEISEIKEEFKGKEPIKIFDDCFFSNTKRFSEVSELIGKYGIRFEVNARLMALSKEKIDTFKKNGGGKLFVGVESGSQKILDLIKKRIKLEDIIKQTKLITNENLSWTAFFVVGFPFETLDDIKRSEELAYKIQPTFISLNRFTPYPGTEIWREYYKNAKLKFIDLFQLNPHVMKLDSDIEEYIEKMFNGFDKYNKK